MRTEYQKCFEYGVRADGANYCYVSGDKYPELSELIRIIHEDLGCSIPNDWIYNQIFEAFGLLDEFDIDDLQLEPDIYYMDLYKWFGESFAHHLVNEAIAELGPLDCIYAYISHAQLIAMDSICRHVNDFMLEEIEE